MNSINTIMHRLHNPDLGILFIRLAVGIVFINAGWFKLTNLETVLTGFAFIGIPAALTYLVACGEFLGGIALILGIFVRYAGIILAIIMAVAIVKVHWVNGFSIANGGYKYVMVLLLASLAVVTLGSGKYSLTRLLEK